MDYLLQWHNIGKKPLNKYCSTSVPDHLKIGHVLISLAKNKKIDEITISNYKLGVLCGWIKHNDDEKHILFVRNKIQKALDKLEHGLAFIERTQIPLGKGNGSRRTIKLNWDVIDDVLSTFDWRDMSKISLPRQIKESQRKSFYIKIRKWIKYRILSLMEAKRKSKRRFYELLEAQANSKYLDGIVKLIQDLKFSDKEMKMANKYWYEYLERWKYILGNQMEKWFPSSLKPLGLKNKIIYIGTSVQKDLNVVINKKKLFKSLECHDIRNVIFVQIK